MTRLTNWQNNLTDLIEANKEKPFDFVAHNCLLWAGLGIEAVTGQNPISKIVGQYSNEKEALRYLKNVAKVTTVQQFLQQELQQENKAISFARHGDIVFIDPATAEETEILCGSMFGKVPGLCYGQISFFLGEFGLISVETLTLDACLWVL